MNTGCEFYADALVELADGRLEPDRVERVEAHLADCGDCRAALDVIQAVRRSPAPVTEGLEARIRSAVRGEGTSAEERAAPTIGVERRGGAPRWRPWALPLAAAAAVAIWLGGSAILGPGDGTGAGAGEAVADYEPYGAWPASDGVVAGDLVLSDLTVEELETLLEEMER